MHRFHTPTKWLVQQVSLFPPHAEGWLYFHLCHAPAAGGQGRAGTGLWVGEEPSGPFGCPAEWMRSRREGGGLLSGHTSSITRPPPPGRAADRKPPEGDKDRKNGWCDVGGFCAATRPPWCGGLCTLPQSHHAGSLTVANVWVQPGQTPQYASQSRNSDPGRAIETGVAWHRSQQVLLNLRDKDEPTWAEDTEVWGTGKSFQHCV